MKVDSSLLHYFISILWKNIASYLSAPIIISPHDKIFTLKSSVLLKKILLLGRNMN